MQELSDGLQAAMMGSFEKASAFDCVEKTLRETTKKWAAYCCNELDGELLKKGLEISRVIVAFLNAIEREDSKMLKQESQCAPQS